MKEVKGPLKSKYQAHDKELDEIFDVLASAELMIEEAKIRGLIDFKFDYSGIIILYCKAVEILELRKSEKLRSEIHNSLHKYITKIDYYFFDFNRIDTLKISPELSPIRMQEKTPYKLSEIECTKDIPKKDDLNVFFIEGPNKTGIKKQLAEFLEKDSIKMKRGQEIYKMDMKFYNALLYMYYYINKNIDYDKFDLFKDVFLLYIKHRNGSAHTHIKSSEDANKVRIILMGDENSNNESMVYRLIHSLN